MKKNLSLIGIIFVFLLGCLVRTHKVTRERVDQEIVGNRGYLQGSPKQQVLEKKPTRTIQQVEIELHPLIKFEKLSPQKKTTLRTEDKELWGNLGYIVKKPVISEEKPHVSFNVSIEKYTVQKGDTLEKISQRFYGSRRFWYRIYELNKDIIKDPNRIYPGQIINIPVEEKKEPKNLK
jgi:nucleoid-associated protein YgaU